MAVSFLLPSQIRQIKQALLDAKLDPQQFEMTAEDVLRVKHPASGFRFTLAPEEVMISISAGSVKGHAYNVTYVPFKAPRHFRPTEPGGEGSILKWDKVLSHYNQWLQWLSEEIDITDPWEEAQRYSKAVLALQDSEEFFLPHEVKKLQAQLQQLTTKVEASQLPEAAIRELTAAIRDASVKSERMSKKDWVNMFSGTILNTMISVALNPEQAMLVTTLVKAAFTSLTVLLQ